MTPKDTVKKADINQCIAKLNKTHKQRLGTIGPLMGMLLIILFAFALLPLFLFLMFFNKVYFWIRKQKYF